MKAIKFFAHVTIAAVMTGAAAAQEPAPPGASSCTGCHSGTATAIPKIQGRKAEQIVAFMKVFREGKAPATVMDRIAKGFTDAEVAAIAAWLARQK